MEIVGKIHIIEPLVEIPTKSGSTFSKRGLVLDCTRYDQMTGQPYPNYPRFEFGGKNANATDGFQVGQLVKVSFALQGTEYEDKNDHQKKYFTSIVGWKVEAFQANAQQPVAQPTTQAAPAVMAPPVPPAEDGGDLPF